MKIKCFKTYIKRNISFKEGEEYNGNQVNENWFCIDAIGIVKDDFNEHFEMIDE